MRQQISCGNFLLISISSITNKHYHYYKSERKHVFHPLKLLAFCNFYER